MKIYIALLAAVMSFGAAASSECFKAPEQFSQDHNGINKQSLATQKNDEMSNPILEISMCMMQAAFQNPADILKNICGCKQAVREACEFDTSDLTFSGPAACLTFAPWAL
jgi:hypothetical protein